LHRRDEGHPRGHHQGHSRQQEQFQRAAISAVARTAAEHAAAHAWRRSRRRCRSTSAMNRTHLIAAAVAAGFVAIIGASSLFTVHQTQQALVLQVGEPREVVTTPGLHAKLPWPFQNVLYLDKRVLNVDLPAEEVIASDRKRL